VYIDVLHAFDARIIQLQFEAPHEFLEPT